MVLKATFDQMVADGVTTRETIDKFFFLLSSATLDEQIAMTLTPNDFGTEYTTFDGKIIKVEN